MHRPHPPHSLFPPLKTAPFPSPGASDLHVRSEDSGAGWKWLRRRRVPPAPASVRQAVQADCVRSPKMARLEAALFVADGALAPRRLVQVATLADAREAVSLVEQLNAAYDETGSPFRIERVASGYQLLSRAELASWLDRVHHRSAHLKLSPPTLETLAIIAYRQPCTRADLEAIRGVQSAELIKQLMERNLVRVAGEDDSLGRPYLYGTTRLFLESFGLTSLNDLPMTDLLRLPPPEADSVEQRDEPRSEAA